MKNFYSMFLMMLLPLVVVSFTSCSSSDSKPDPVREALVTAVVGEYECSVGESYDIVKMVITRGESYKVNIMLPKVFDGKTLIYNNLNITGAELGGTLAMVNVLYKGAATALAAPATYAEPIQIETNLSGTVSTGGKINFTLKVGEGAEVKTITIKNKTYSIEEITENSVGTYGSKINGTIYVVDENGAPDPEQTVLLENEPAKIILSPSANSTSKVDLDLEGFEFSGLAIPVNLKDVEIVKDGEKGAKINHVGETEINIGIKVMVAITVSGTIVDGVIDLDLSINAMDSILGDIKITGNKE